MILQKIPEFLEISPEYLDMGFLQSDRSSNMCGVSGVQTCAESLHISRVWQNQPELHWLKCADPFSEGSKDSTALQTV
jgi:hypothetical protein